MHLRSRQTSDGHTTRASGPTNREASLPLPFITLSDSIHQVSFSTKTPHMSVRTWFETRGPTIACWWADDRVSGKRTHERVKCPRPPMRNCQGARARSVIVFAMTKTGSAIARGLKGHMNGAGPYQ